MDFARAAEVLEGVQRAPGLGVAAAPAQVDLAAPDARAGIAQSRLRAARSWLYALGYLAEDHDSGEYDAVLSRAVRSFQREAGLVVDGWLGEAETWPRLQELIAFEHPLDPAFWGDSRGGPKPALARAVGTRLRLYGIAAPRGDGPALDAAVRAFFDLKTRLGAPRESLGLDRTRWLAGVLDHDRHLGAVVRGAGSGRGVAVLAAPDEEPSTVQAISLLLNMAKIELWLAQGARTQLGQVHRARRGADQRWVLPSAIRGDMKAYMDWIDEENSDAAPLRQAYRAALRRGRPEQALVHFLTATQRFAIAEDPFASERLAQLHDFYGGGVARRRARAEATVARLSEPRSLRARLWDGIRRIWSWLGRALRRVAETGRNALRLARDIAAYAFRAATEGLRHVLGAIGAFMAHLRIAVRRHHADPMGRVVQAREFGRDVNLLVTSGTPPDHVARVTEWLRLSARIFRRACTILGGVIGLGISLIGMPVGGPLVLRLLIGAVRDLPGLLTLGRELHVLRARHAALSEVLGA